MNRGHLLHGNRGGDQSAEARLSRFTDSTLVKSFGSSTPKSPILRSRPSLASSVLSLGGVARIRQPVVWWRQRRNAASQGKFCMAILKLLLLFIGSLSLCAQSVPQAPAPTKETRDLNVEALPASVSALPSSDRRWALLVGVDQYQDKQITPLTGAAADAHALADALVKYAGFDPQHVIVLATDLPAERQPTKGNILVRLSNISDRPWTRRRPPRWHLSNAT